MKNVTIIPKLEYRNMDGVYIGALIIANKKNDQPIIFTDAHGAILGSNKQVANFHKASNLISPKRPIEKGSLFLMIPRLFQFYYPMAEEPSTEKKQSQTNRNPIQSLDQLKEININQNSEGYLAQIDELLIKEEKRATFSSFDDCFMFKMLQHAGQTTHLLLQSPSEIQNKSIARQNWDKVKKELISHGLAPINYSFLLKTIYENRRLILEDLPNILRISIKLETKIYQRGLVLKQVILESVHSTGNKAQKFFKILADSVRVQEQLMDVLCISPEDLNNICKLLSFRQNLQNSEKNQREERPYFQRSL